MGKFYLRLDHNPHTLSQIYLEILLNDSLIYRLCLNELNHPYDRLSGAFIVTLSLENRLCILNALPDRAGRMAVPNSSFFCEFYYSYCHTFSLPAKVRR